MKHKVAFVVFTLLSLTLGLVAHAGPTYDKLKAVLEDPVLSTERETIKEALLNYHEVALKENAGKGKKTGNLRRIIYLLSSNPKKTAEFVKDFDKYGIEVFRAPPSKNPIYLNLILTALDSQSGASTIRVIAAQKEDSKLIDSFTGEDFTENYSAINNGREVRHFSHLKVYYLDKKLMREKDYEFSIEGIIEHSKKQPESSDIFGWDDIFLRLGLAKAWSNYDLAQMGFKVSSRNMGQSAYIKDFIYYKKPEDLKWHPVKQEQVIAVDNLVSNFIKTIPYYNNNLVGAYGIESLFNSVSNAGIFFRSPFNRRGKNYWLPGLNAGVPYTQKKDEIHELTYLAHDFGHFAIRDLIFTGNDSPVHRQVYIAYRMMSEAITMIFADMLFIDSLKQTGVKYDFSERKIYPVLEATGIDFSDEINFLANLKNLMKANVYFALRGDDSVYRQLLKLEPEKTSQVLEDFKTKYTPFMVEDFRWTVRNYENMASRKEEIAKWWLTVESFQKLGPLEFETIDDFISKLKKEDGDLIDQVFEAIFRNLIEPIFTQKIELGLEETQIRNAFIRYISGQFGIFSHYEMLVKETDMYQKRILSELWSYEPISLGKISTIRAMYNDYLNVLVEKHLISHDDRNTYAEIYPLFEPFFVSYDREKESYEKLSDVSKLIFSEQ